MRVHHVLPEMLCGFTRGIGRQVPKVFSRFRFKERQNISPASVHDPGNDRGTDHRNDRDRHFLRICRGSFSDNAKQRALSDEEGTRFPLRRRSHLPWVHHHLWIEPLVAQAAGNWRGVYAGISERSTLPAPISSDHSGGTAASSNPEA
jgi:hypothetical protein